MKHAKLAPSSAARWMLCPGSTRYADDTRPESAAAERGSRLHALAYRAITTGTPVETLVENDEEAAAIRPYVQFGRELIESGKPCGFEARVDISGITGEKQAFGTIDAWCISGSTLTVADLKTGVEQVQPDSPQLMIYAAAKLAEFPAAEEVLLLVFQPYPQPVLLQRKEFERLVRRIKRAAKIALRVDAPLVPGEKQCRWCPGLARCPEARDFVSEAVRDESLERASETLPLVKRWVSAVEQQVELTLLSGGNIPGWKVVYGRRPPRQWADMERADSVLAGILGDAAYTRELLSPSQAEKVLRAAGAGAELLDGLVVQGEPKRIVVPESDNREAVTTEPVQFPNLEN